MSDKRRYVTTPIYYVNDKPHVGHAYTTLACDVTARFLRLDGWDVRLLTGTDEHGQKVQQAAAAAGMEPQAFCDQVSQSFRDLIAVMGFAPDDFIRTTEPRHKRACQALWERLRARDEIYLGQYEGWYATRDEAFYVEGETVVGPDGVRRAAASGAEVAWMAEESWFFRLAKWGPALIALYEREPERIGPASRRNEVLGFLRSEGGLRDLSISRTAFDWGIPVPGAPGHVMYVWIDALTNYMSAVGYPDETHELWRFWPADLHMVGKDILRFHAVYWPAMLLAAGLEPPRRVFAHGWWTNEGQKISKSLGNVIDPVELVATYGLDPVRYFLLREVPFGNDGDFRRDQMASRINTDLANDLGNLAQRALSMIAKNCAGRVPTPGAFVDDDQALLDAARALLARARAEIEVQAFHKALEAIWDVIGAANRYVDRQAPWALRKTDPERMATVLYVLAETVRRVALLVQPVMPGSAAKLLDQLAVPADGRGFDHFDVEMNPGTALPAPVGVFPRWQPPAAAEG